MDKAIELYLLGMVNALVVIRLQVKRNVSFRGLVDFQAVGGMVPEGEELLEVVKHLVGFEPGTPFGGHEGLAIIKGYGVVVRKYIEPGAWVFAEPVHELTGIGGVITVVAVQKGDAADTGRNFFYRIKVGKYKPAASTMAVQVKTF